PQNRHKDQNQAPPPAWHSAATPPAPLDPHAPCVPPQHAHARIPPPQCASLPPATPRSPARHFPWHSFATGAVGGCCRRQPAPAPKQRRSSEQSAAIEVLPEKHPERNAAFQKHRGTGFAGPQVLPPLGGMRLCAASKQRGGASSWQFDFGIAGEGPSAIDVVDERVDLAQ